MSDPATTPSLPGADAIVVAVAEEGYDAALRFAVEEACRRGSAVHLMHVLRLPGEVYAELQSDHDAAARALLAEAMTRAEELGRGEVTVTTSLSEDGWLAQSIVECANRGRLAVLQHRRFGALHRLVTRSVVNGVASRAQVPVVSVPEGWVPRPGAAPVVTVAVQETSEAPALVRLAASEAGRRGARLVLMHAWWLANGYDVVVVDQGMRDDWAARARAELEPAIVAVRREVPHVPITLEVRHGPIAEVLLDAAQHSDLLVVGRRHYRMALGTHLGPVTRAVLDRSDCPVLVAPEPRPAETVRAPESDPVLA